MTHRFLFSDDADASHTVRASVAVLVAAITLGVMGGCDAVNVHSDDQTDPVTTAFDRADLLYEPVSLASGDRFSIELVDNQFDESIARLVHEGTHDGEYRLRARFSPLQPSKVTVTCRNELTGAKQRMHTLNPEELGPKSAADSTVDSEQEPNSFHYIDNGDNIVVEVDYDTEDSKAKSVAGRFDFASADQSVRCTHVSFKLKDVSASVSADDIRFGGDVKAPSIREKRLQ